MRIALIAAVVVVAVALLAVVPVMVTGADKDVLVRIPAGATAENVADTLTRYLGEGYSGKVMQLLKIRHVDFSKRHGQYLIPKGMSPFSAMRRLGGGAQTPVKITINGFRSLDTMADRISRKIDVNRDSLLSMLRDPKMLSTYGLTPDNAMALYLDDTYELYWTSSASDLIKKVGENYNRVWNPTRRRKAAEIGLSPEEVVILASIVDEETLMGDEKGRIARVYINRLRKGMRLQSDPTVRFALQDFSIRRVRGEHLKVESSYNTYRVSGLPPGPIRTTSVKTIDRILDSKVTNEIYMCAKEDFSGYHNFASDYSEHLKNAMRYQHALDSKGIN